MSKNFNRYGKIISWKRITLVVMAAVMLLCVGVTGIIVSAAVTEAELSDYATVTPYLYANSSGEQLPVYVENGQEIYFQLQITDFNSEELISLLKSQSPVDFTVDLNFTGDIIGSYPTEMYPGNGYDNVAMSNGQALFRWWLDDNTIRIRFDDEWIDGIKDNAVINNAQLGFTGVLNVGEKNDSGGAIFSGAGKDFSLIFKTAYTLEKSAGVPEFRDGKYVVDYSVTFSIDQNMDITGGANDELYSVLLTLNDSVAADGVLTGNLIGEPVLSYSATTGAAVSAENHGTDNVFTLSAPNGVLNKGSYTIKYTMEIDPDAAAARLNGYSAAQKTNTVTLSENVGEDTENKLNVAATIAWNQYLSGRYKVAKGIFKDQPGNINGIYRDGSDYYADFYVAVYLKESIGSFTITDTADAESFLTFTDAKSPTLEGGDSDNGYFGRAAGSHTLTAVDGASVSHDVSVDGKTVTVTVTAPEGQTFAPGAYYVRIPGKVNDAVANTLDTGKASPINNTAELTAADGQSPGETGNYKASVPAYSTPVKYGGYLIGDNSTYNGKRVIRWDLTFGWEFFSDGTTVEDTMNGMDLVVDKEAGFIFEIINNGNVIASFDSLEELNNASFITFADGDAADSFSLATGTIGNGEDVTKPYNLVYYTVPKDGTDESALLNDYTITYKEPNGDASAGINPPGEGVAPSVDRGAQLTVLKSKVNQNNGDVINNTTTRWTVTVNNVDENDSSKTRIPITNMTKLNIIDILPEQPRGFKAWFDHEWMATSGYPLTVTMEYAPNKTVTLEEGVHYTVLKEYDQDGYVISGTEEDGVVKYNGFVISMNIDAVKTLLAENGADAFRTVKVVSYAKNENRHTYTTQQNERRADMKNEAYVDYDNAGVEIEDASVTVSGYRQFATIEKSSDGEYADIYNASNHTYEPDGDGIKEILWKLHIGAAEFEKNPEDFYITIRDTLPEGMYFPGCKDENWKNNFKVYARNNPSVSIDLNSESSEAQFSWDEETNTFALTFRKPGGAWAGGNWKSSDIIIEYNTAFTSEALQQAADGATEAAVTLRPSNSASVEWAGDVNGTPTATPDVLISDLVFSKQGAWIESSGSKVRYTIEINPYALDLDSSTNVIELVDDMSANQDSTVYLENTFKLINLATGREMTSGAAADADTYVIVWNDDHSSFTLTVPDNTPITLTYQVKCTLPVGTNASISNFASLAQRTAAPSSVTFKVGSAFQSGSFTVPPGTAAVRVFKVDSRDGDTAVSTLAGAQFTATRLEAGENLVWTKVEDSASVQTTQADQPLVFTHDFANGEIVLLVEETAAPAGYLLGTEPWSWCYVFAENLETGNAIKADLTSQGFSNVTVVVEDSYIDETVTNEPFSITLVKKNEQDTAIDGAQFVLTDSTGTVIAADTGAMPTGTLRYSGLASGEYTLTETAAPADYVLDRAESSWKFTVSAENGTITLPGGADYELFTVDGTAMQMTVVNRKPTASVTLEAEKILEGLALTEGQFSFELIGADIATQTATNDAAGKITFAPITYTYDSSYAGDGRQFVYSIREIEPSDHMQSADGITYDNTEYRVTVRVSLDTESGEFGVQIIDIRTADGTDSTKAVFINKYEPAPTSVQITAAKILSGSDLDAGQFSFVLCDKDGNQIGEPVTNKADGTIEFPVISYTDTGVYEYRVKEVIPSDSDVNITYDNTEYTVKVEITHDEQNAQLSAGLEFSIGQTVLSDTDVITFVNIYSTSEDNPSDNPDDENLPGTYTLSFVKKNNFNKALDGATFSLTAEGYEKTATSAEGGTVSFSDLVPGSYILTEVSAPAGYIKSDIAVAVTLDANGAFSFKAADEVITKEQVEELLVNNISKVDGGSKDVVVGEIIDLRDELDKKFPDLKDKELVWQSTNTDVAIVDKDGNVTVKGTGSTTITVFDGKVPLMSFVLGASNKNNSDAGNQNSNQNNNPVYNQGANNTPNTSDTMADVNIAVSCLILSALLGLFGLRSIRRRKAGR